MNTMNLSVKSMSLFFETIKIIDGSVHNLDYHQARMNRTLDFNFSKHSVPYIGSIISVPEIFQKGLVKCRIDYNNNDFKVSFERYKPRQINSLKVLQDNSINYNFKYSDRSNIVKLMEGRGNCDDILIVKQNMITDTSFTNIIFQDGNVWYTPSTPLLYGTARARLLAEGRISEQEIRLDDLPKFSNFKLINSMLNDDFTDLKPMSAIVI